MADDTSPAPASAHVAPKSAPPGRWAALKRPPPVPPKDHDPRATERVHFDVRFAVAAHLGRWEDEWPQMTEAQFDAAITAAGKLEFGGHHPDGTHPRASKE